MKTTRIYHSLLLAAALATVLLITAISASRARAEERDNSSRIAFSDPTKPGTLQVVIKMGDIVIAGTDDDQVTVHTDMEAADAPRRSDGLRVISESVTFSLTEKNNIVTLDTGDEFWSGSSGDAEFNILVPHNTNIIVKNGYGGEVSVSNISGNIEIQSLNGEIDLDEVSGGCLVETMNGEIAARITALHADKPLSFTSMNGEIELYLPADAQANVRLRTQNGAILTDFDEKALVTQTKAIGDHRTRIRVKTISDTDIKVAVREAVRAGVEAAREAAEALREAAQAAREAAQAEREEAIQANELSRTAPIPPVPPVPTMTGGRQVSGTLNGGAGPEIYANAMNGDITLRKIE